MMTYQDLFGAYLHDMREAISAARRWWVALLAEETVHQGDAERAREALARRWPFGIASHPFIIAAYRHWSLECQRINDDIEADEADDEDEFTQDESDWGAAEPSSEVDEMAPTDLADLEGPIEPRELLIDMLPGRADDIAELMLDFVFDPVGLDENDRWV